MADHPYYVVMSDGTRVDVEPRPGRDLLLELFEYHRSFRSQPGRPVPVGIKRERLKGEKEDAFIATFGAYRVGTKGRVKTTSIRPSLEPLRLSGPPDEFEDDLDE